MIGAVVNENVVPHGRVDAAAICDTSRSSCQSTFYRTTIVSSRPLARTSLHRSGPHARARAAPRASVDDELACALERLPQRLDVAQEDAPVLRLEVAVNPCARRDSA